MKFSDKWCHSKYFFFIQGHFLRSKKKNKQEFLFIKNMTLFIYLPHFILWVKYYYQQRIALHVWCILVPERICFWCCICNCRKRAKYDKEILFEYLCSMILYYMPFIYMCNIYIYTFALYYMPFIYMWSI